MGSTATINVTWDQAGNASDNTLYNQKLLVNGTSHTLFSGWNDSKKGTSNTVTVTINGISVACTHLYEKVFNENGMNQTFNSRLKMVIGSSTSIIPVTNYNNQAWSNNKAGIAKTIRILGNNTIVIVP